MKKQEEELIEIYNSLLNTYGHRNWWPAEGPFEVIIGAILTQNVSWDNASKAIANLKAANKLDPIALYNSSPRDIAPLIKPSRFYNIKSVKIKNFMDFFFNEYGGDMKAMSNEDPAILRKKLLAVKGLGKETVDAIMLYACRMPVFVVDAYTKRILQRYGTLKGDPSYDEIQGYFMDNLPKDRALYNDFHAQIVHLGNSICKSTPRCGACPIASMNGLTCEFHRTNKIKKVI
jgi:endonuclease-3 related protein